MIPRERDPVHGRERIHHADDIVRPELRLHEPNERLLARRASCRAGRDSRRRRTQTAGRRPARSRSLRRVGCEARAAAVRQARRIAVHANQSELIDRLRLAVLEHLEVGVGQIGHRRALAIVDDDVHADEVDVGAEGGLLRVRRPAGGRLRRAAGRRVFAQLPEEHRLLGQPPDDRCRPGAGQRNRERLATVARVISGCSAFSAIIPPESGQYGRESSPASPELARDL